jgi:4-hydroxy-3-methylbut-2-enyl diphosphate reductase
MKIVLAKSAGFCFGVKRAIDIALEAALKYKDICMVGDIVHNEDVARQIELAGIKKVSALKDGKGKVFLIRAHGAATAVMQRAKNKGYKIIDATCPMVKEIHHIAGDMEKKGYRIIVIGDRNHDEVKGILGHLKRGAILIEDAGHIPVAALKKIARACVVTQSTQNMDKVLDIVAILRQYIKKVEFFNTICRPTRIRQEEIKKMPLENDVMIIIGSRSSANTKRLYEISKSINKRSYWVNSPKEIRRGWFTRAKTVGITAGASTPDTTTQAVIRRIQKIR